MSGVSVTAVPARDGLPAHLLRRDPRARNVRLRVTDRDGLVVTVPPRAARDAAERALRANGAWVERRLAETAERRALFERGAEALLPDVVEFQATGERWGVDYRHGAGVRVRVLETAGTLVVAGGVSDGEACLAALRRWLDRAAAARLGALLDGESARLGLPYARARVRRMRTRWGTCSRAGVITLNTLLVFRPAERARCTAAHELVHTLRHDHSPAFRAELERLFPGAHGIERAGRHDMREVPPWAAA